MQSKKPHLKLVKNVGPKGEPVEPKEYKVCLRVRRIMFNECHVVVEANSPEHAIELAQKAKVDWNAENERTYRQKSAHIMGDPDDKMQAMYARGVETLARGDFTPREAWAAATVRARAGKSMSNKEAAAFVKRAEAAYRRGLWGYDGGAVYTIPAKR